MMVSLNLVALSIYSLPMRILVAVPLLNIRYLSHLLLLLLLLLSFALLPLSFPLPLSPFPYPLSLPFLPPSSLSSLFPGDLLVPALFSLSSSLPLPSASPSPSLIPFYLSSPICFPIYHTPDCLSPPVFPPFLPPFPLPPSFPFSNCLLFAHCILFGIPITLPGGVPFCSISKTKQQGDGWDGMGGD